MVSASLLQMTAARGEISLHCPAMYRTYGRCDCCLGDMVSTMPTSLCSLLTMHSTVTVRWLKSVPVNCTGDRTFQPGGSPEGPTSGAPALYAAWRSCDGGSARDNGV